MNFPHIHIFMLEDHPEDYWFQKGAREPWRLKPTVPLERCKTHGCGTIKIPGAKETEIEQ